MSYVYVSGNIPMDISLMTTTILTMVSLSEMSLLALGWAFTLMDLVHPQSH